MIQDKPMPNVAFRGMAFALRVMEPFKHSRERLAGAGLEKGQVVLEYGCGIGSYTIPAAQIVGDDTFHLVQDKQALLEELHRVLKPGGFLSADHMHTARDDFLETMQVGNLFSFQSQGEESFTLKVFTFGKCVT